MSLQRRPTWLFWLLAALILLAWQRHDVAAQGADSKLTTILRDVARVVSQEFGPMPATATPTLAPPIAKDALPVSARDAVRLRRMRLNPHNDVQVYVLVTDVTADVEDALARAGAVIEIADAPSRRVQAHVNVSRLRAVASLPFVTFVRLPTYAAPHAGARTTEGDAILSADTARQQFGVDGTGVRVGVISDGLRGVFATRCLICGGVSGGPIASGDLPPASGTRDVTGLLVSSSGITGRSFQANGDLEGIPEEGCAFDGAGAEGTALLEVVHDLAPGARLSFANADTDLAFTRAVNYLASFNDVVVDDLGFFGEPADGTSLVSTNTAAALNSATNRIRAYVTSAGNQADIHYFGSYVDSGVDGSAAAGFSSAGHLHLFQPSAGTSDVLNLGAQPHNVIALAQGGEVGIVLGWNDQAAKSANNYDLYLVRESDGQVVARSTDVQNGAQDALEFVDFVNSGASGQFRVVVQNVGNAAQPRQLNIFSFQPSCADDGPRLLAVGRHERLNYTTAERSLSAQSDSGGSPVSAMSVAAICSASADAAAVFARGSVANESCNDHTHSTAEYFSSRGPTLDGRNKPDISAIDGVSITGAGQFPKTFFGTSAAAPHVAGIAALVLQAAPCLMDGGTGAVGNASARAAVRSAIVSSATPIGASPPDTTFGAGLANAFGALQRVLPISNGPSSLSIAANAKFGARVTAAQLGFADPNGCAITRLAWTGGCGTSPGNALTCPFGTTVVSVSASSNGLTFSTPRSVQITVH